MKTLCFLASKILFFFFLSVPSWAAITLSLIPAAQNVGISGTVKINLFISGLDSDVASSISTYDVTIGFDPLILSPSSAIFGDPTLGNQLDLLGLGSLNNVTREPGRVNLFELSFDDPVMLDTQQADAFTLAQFIFSALQPGSTILDLSVNALGDSLGDPLKAFIVSGNVLVDGIEIPEPSSLLLLMTGFCLSAVFRRAIRYHAA